MNTEVTIIPYQQMERMAQSIVKSGLFGFESLDQALALMWMAEAEGKHPATIAQDFHIIQRRPAKKAEAMHRDFIKGGGTVKWIQLDDSIAKAKFSHPLGGEVTIEWDMERAKKAGLLGKQGDMYNKYSRPMLRSRCLSEGIRTVGPFATSGVYSTEEIRGLADVPPEEIKDVTPPPSGHTLEAELVSDHLVVIDNAADLEDLRRAFQAAYIAAKAAGDFAAVEQFQARKDARKRELTAEDA